LIVVFTFWYRASLTALSARSLPVIPMWDGIHISLRFKPSFANKSFNPVVILFLCHDIAKGVRYHNSFHYMCHLLVVFIAFMMAWTSTLNMQACSSHLIFISSGPHITELLTGLSLQIRQCTLS
jgi:hypothetical protein